MATSLTKKLQLKSGQTLGILNPPEEYSEQLSAELPDLQLTLSPEPGTSAVLLFVNNLAEASELFPTAAEKLAPEGLLWVAYPKQSSGIKTDANRDTLWQTLAQQEWRPVRQIAIDETWSAIRFRPNL